MTKLAEPLPELFTRSRRLVLHFASIPKDTPKQESIAEYFKTMHAKGLDPKLPEHRQAFNDHILDRTHERYLVSAYGEDRMAMLKGSSIAREGRTIHLGVDIFSKALESVMAPCDGTIVRVGREDETHSFGNFVILRPDLADIPLLFFGHLGFDLPAMGDVEKGQIIGALGDYRNNENGGWSRHLHLQCLSELPPEDKAPLGYASRQTMPDFQEHYPDPMQYFSDWRLGRVLS